MLNESAGKKQENGRALRKKRVSDEITEKNGDKNSHWCPSGQGWALKYKYDCMGCDGMGVERKFGTGPGQSQEK